MTVNILKGVYKPSSGAPQAIEPKKLNKPSGKRGITVEVDYLARRCLGHTDEGSPFTLKLSTRKVEILVEGKTAHILTRKGQQWVRNGKSSNDLNHAQITKYVRAALLKMSHRDPGKDSISLDSAEEADIEAETKDSRDRSVSIHNHNYIPECPHCGSSRESSDDISGLKKEITRLSQSVDDLQRSVDVLGRQKAKGSKTHKESLIILQKNADRVEKSVDDTLSAIQETHAKQNREIEELRGRVEKQAELEEVLQQVIAEKEQLQQRYEQLSRSSENTENELLNTSFVLTRQQQDLEAKIAQLEEERQTLLNRQAELNDTVAVAEQAATIATQKITALKKENNEQNATVKALEGRIEQQEAALTEQQTENSQSQKQIASLTNELRNLKIDYASSEHDRVQAEKAEQKRSADLQAANAERQQLEERSARIAAGDEEKSARLDELWVKNAAMEEQLHKTTQLLLNAKELLRKFDANKQTLKNENKTLQTRVTDLSTEKNMLEDAVDRLTDDSVQLETRLQKVKLGLVALNQKRVAEKQQVETELDKVSRENRVLEAALDGFADKHIQLMQETDAMKKEIQNNAVASEMIEGALKGDNTALHSKVQKLQNEKSALEKKLEEATKPVFSVPTTLVDSPLTVSDSPSSIPDSLADVAKAGLASALDDLTPLQIPLPTPPSASSSASSAQRLNRVALMLFKGLSEMHTTLRDADQEALDQIMQTHLAPLTATLSPPVLDGFNPEELAAGAEKFLTAVTDINHLLDLAQLESKQKTLKAVRAKAIARVAAKKLKESLKNQTLPTPPPPASSDSDDDLDISAFLPNPSAPTTTPLGLQQAQVTRLVREGQHRASTLFPDEPDFFTPLLIEEDTL